MKETYYQRNREKALSRYQRLASLYVGWRKTLQCSRCFEDDYNCLDFHHVDPNEKEYSVANLVGSGSKAVVKELKKCVVVCSNCHRKVHAHNIQVKITEDLGESFENFIKFNNAV